MDVTGIRLSAATAIGGRDRNEDAVGVDGWVLSGDPRTPLDVLVPLPVDGPVRIAVVDGMGGLPDGERAAVLAVRLLTSGVSFEHADQEIRASGTGMACTAALVSVSANGDTEVANVGDVRVYRVQDGYAAQLSEDHRTDPTTVTRSLGGTETPPTPAVRTVHLRPGDRLVLCTDGVHDTVPKPTIATTSTGPTRDAVHRLIRAATESPDNDNDNATAVVLELMGR